MKIIVPQNIMILQYLFHVKTKKTDFVSNYNIFKALIVSSSCQIL